MKEQPMETQTASSIFQECDFCKLRGVVGKNLFNRDGWYFCKPCLLEIDAEIEKRRETAVRD